jgi:hypothetical protein
VGGCAECYELLFVGNLGEYKPTSHTTAVNTSGRRGGSYPGSVFCTHFVMMIPERSIYSSLEYGDMTVPVCSGRS